MRRLAPCLLLSTVACDAAVECPLIEYIDEFSIVLSDDTWRAAHYEIEASYEDDLGSFKFACDVDIPAYADDGAIDGGVNIATDAATKTAGYFACRPPNATGRRAHAQVGRELVLNFEGTPEEVHLIVRENGNVVLDNPHLRPAYRTRFRPGECGHGGFLGAVEVPLPRFDAAVP